MSKKWIKDNAVSIIGAIVTLLTTAYLVGASTADIKKDSQFQDTRLTKVESKADALDDKLDDISTALAIVVEWVKDQRRRDRNHE